MGLYRISTYITTNKKNTEYRFGKLKNSPYKYKSTINYARDIGDLSNKIITSDLMISFLK